MEWGAESLLIVIEMLHVNLDSTLWQSHDYAFCSHQLGTEVETRDSQTQHSAMYPPKVRTQIPSHLQCRIFPPPCMPASMPPANISVLWWFEHWLVLCLSASRGRPCWKAAVSGQSTALGTGMFYPQIPPFTLGRGTVGAACHLWPGSLLLCGLVRTETCSYLTKQFS